MAMVGVLKELLVLPVAPATVVGGKMEAVALRRGAVWQCRAPVGFILG